MAEAALSAELNDVVTKHMSTQFARIESQRTVAEALDEVRAQTISGRIIYFYVVDGGGRLQGVVPTRSLLLSPPERPITEIMIRNVIAIPTTATVLEACEFFTLHRLLAFPVVDEERRIMGVVDVELYTDELDEIEQSERLDDLFQLIGVHLVEAQQGSAVTSFKLRFPWLLCNIGGGVLAAFLSGMFQAELERAVALALFIPVVLSLAEGVSIQSVSLALQVLHGTRPTWRSMALRLKREMGTGLLLGLVSSTIVALVAWAWIGEPRVALCILVGIAGGVSSAAVVGLALPNLLRLLNRDPQVAAGPVALVSSDVVTLLIYFNLARLLI